MASQEQIYTTRILLNSEQAKKEIDQLNIKIEQLKKKRDEAWTAGNVEGWKKLGKEIEKNEGKIRQMEGSLRTIDKTLGNMSVAGPKELKKTIKEINRLLNDGSIERGSEQWKALTAALQDANTELAKIRQETKAQESLWSRFVSLLNKNWGAITQIIGAISGLTLTIRKAVQDYAQMEEEMADVRKYTGMVTEQVHGLNEEFKKMDTRTPREELNRLAGSAGRLGKQSKKDVMEFVEAADMIGIALGDDLGDGAVDKIGKLAMAFGEDEKKGLKGAMLSTGSAINELVQNSSAQAGYLVEFTARVAGFGKQIGLTQAQIMGFGTVMDENLLKDEMAATAFGNMLTKMQTDTEKFARIAGLNVREFTDLLNKDANAAILALADNLKKADPQNMMKMLDDMGLDGSRAVGVLSTLADKIDDVRKHQERATEAYKKATSVQNEFNIMNNTVQARLEKCRKKFKEMAVELGERLLPVVKYTITSASVLARTLSALTGFLNENLRVVVVLSAQVTILTAMWKAHTIWLAVVNTMNKTVALSNASLTASMTLLRSAGVALHAVWALLTKGVAGYTAVMRAARLASLTNPWTALATVLSVVGVAIYGVVKAQGELKRKLQEQDPVWRAARAHAQDMADINKRMNSETAKEIATINRLTNVIRSNSYSIGERRSAIEQLQQIVPGYHASIRNEGKLIEENKGRLTEYINELKKTARAQAYMDKLAEIENERLDNEMALSRKQNNLRAVDAELQRGERMGVRNPYKSKKTTRYSSSGPGSGTFVEVEQNDRLTAKLEERRKQEESVNRELKKREEITRRQQALEQQMQKDGIAANVPGGSPSGNTSTAAPPIGYKTEAEKKKEEQERHKREIEERKRLKEAEDAAKAETDAIIAEKTHEYAMGGIAYREYIQEMARLQKEGLEKRRDVYQKGSTEYEKLNRQVEELSFKGERNVNSMKLEDLQRCMLRQQAMIETQAAREEITEDEKQERLRMLNETFLADKVELYMKGSKERIDAEWELEQTEQRNKLERERQYQQQLEQVREQYLGMNNERQMQIAMNGLDELHKKGLLKKKEYLAALAALQAQYASYQTTSERNQQVGSNMLRVAGDAARKELDGKPGSDTPFLNDIMQYQTTMEKLKELYGNDKENHDAYLAAKQQATAQFCENMAAKMQAAYNAVNQVMSAASSYFSAQQEYETSLVQKKYEKEIEAAGNNQKKVKQIQEKQAKEEAAIKTKYAKKAAVIQMAQAVAQTAISAINAYSSAAAIPITGTFLAPIAASAAIAAGMLQIATIKKQQQAQEAGYYEGGFTGGRRYRKEAGVVHEGEFVANHKAVENPAIMPFLNFLDQAQRNNTVGSLTSADVSRSVGSTQVVAPIVNVQNNNDELRDTVEASREATEMLVQKLDDGIESYMVVDDNDVEFLYRKLKRHERLINKK